MTYSALLLLISLTCAAQSRSVIVLPAGPAVDPSNRNATILDIETWKPIGNPAVGIDAYNAFTLPDGSKTYVVAKGAANTVTVLAELSSGGRVLKSIDLPAGSTDAALTPDGKRLLIVSMTDPALTVINTATDRVIARIPLAAPANSVVVNFDSTVAFTASPNGARITFINLGGNYTINTINGWTVDVLAANTVMASLPLQKNLPVASRLAFAPNGQLYIVAGDLLLEIDPNTQTVTGPGIAAKGADGRPQFLLDGSQTLMAGSGGLALATLRQFRIDGTYAKPGVSIDHTRIVSESRAIGYSSTDRTFYRIDLKPFLDVTPIAGFTELGRQHVAGFGGTPEDPQNRYLFLSSGSTVYRLDAKSNVITASQSIGNVAGLAISPPVPSRGPVARILAIDPRHPASLPLVARALDASGLPVQGAQVEIGESRIFGGIRQILANADGYAHLDDPYGSSYEIYADTSFPNGFYPYYLYYLYDIGRRPLYPQEAQPAVPSTFRIHRGNGQIVDPGKEAPHTLQVRVLDQRELPIAGVSVEWLISGGGQLKSSQTVTDSRGIATNIFTGPVLSAVQRYLHSTIVATMPGGHPVTFTVATIPAVPSGANDAVTPRAMRLLPFDGQVITATAGTFVGAALRYQISPPIRGISLEVGDSQRKRPVSCNSSSGDDGVVTCTLFVGEGAERAKVYIGGREVEKLPIKVLPGSPEIIRSFGRSYVARNVPVVAVIEDAFGNAVNDVPVNWDIYPRSAGVAMDAKSAPGRYADPQRPSISVPSDGIVSARVSAGATLQLSIPSATGYFLSRATFYVGDGFMFILDGDGQSAASGEDFVRPLVVQLRGDRLIELRGFPVAATGGVVVSPALAFTDAQGRAEFNATAGSDLGPQTVTVTVGLQTITFKLTVTPKLLPPPPAPKPLPAITSIVNGASFAPGLSPCAMAQLTGRNFAVGTYIAIGGHPAPISNSSATSITFQVPCELPPGPTPLQLTSASESVVQQVTIAPYAPGVFENAAKQAVALKADGTYISATNPAELGEEIRLSVTGLGQASPLLVTNTPGSGERMNAKVLIGLGNEGIEADAVYAPALTGTYLVTFRIPRNFMGGANRPIGVAIQTPDGSFIHSQPSRIDIR